MSAVYLCDIDDLEEGSSRGFDIGDEAIFVIHKNGEVAVYKNSCPHLGVELNWLPDQFLDLDGELIQCATHGALFLVHNGECVAGPCQGEFLQPVSFDINNNAIYLTQGTGETARAEPGPG